jgi:GNAT superfamily N-acetyltransferase
MGLVGSMSDGILNRMRNAPAELRWRGALRFSSLVLREFFSPLLYWHVLHVFQRQVQPPQREGTAEFDVKIFAGLANLDRLVCDIGPMGEISAEVIELRLISGDAVALAYSRGEPVGYAWMTFASGLEVAFGVAWFLNARESAFYGSFTHPRWRGRAIQQSLDGALMRYAYEKGVSRVFSTISALNTQMLNAFKHLDRHKIMTLVLVRVRGFNWVYRKSLGAPLESRFTLAMRTVCLPK